MKLIWSNCYQSEQPDNGNKQTYYMEVTAKKSHSSRFIHRISGQKWSQGRDHHKPRRHIQVSSNYYSRLYHPRIELMALMSATDGKIIRGDVFKVPTKVFDI